MFMRVTRRAPTRCAHHWRVAGLCRECDKRDSGWIDHESCDNSTRRRQTVRPVLQFDAFELVSRRQLELHSGNVNPLSLSRGSRIEAPHLLRRDRECMPALVVVSGEQLRLALDL